MNLRLRACCGPSVGVVAGGSPFLWGEPSVNLASQGKPTTRKGNEATMGIFSTLAKNWKLMRIMRRIGMPHSIADLAEQVISQEPSDGKKAERELFDLVCSDGETRAILEHYGATRDDIEAYYRRLSAMGLGRWIQESYVAAAAIAVKPTLIYLLEATNAPLPDGWTEEGRWVKIAFDLARYFESGSLGAVPSDFKPRGSPLHPAAPIVTDSTLAKMPRIISMPDSLMAQLGSIDFDKETYAKAMPHFQVAYRQFVAAGQSLEDFVRWAVSNFGSGIRPYLQQYRIDLAEEAGRNRERPMDMQTIANRIRAEAKKDHKYELGVGGRDQIRMLAKWAEFRPRMLAALKKQGVEKLLARLLDERAMEDWGEKLERRAAPPNDLMEQAERTWHLIEEEEPGPVEDDLDAVVHRVEMGGMLPAPTLKPTSVTEDIS